MTGKWVALEFTVHTGVWGQKIYTETYKVLWDPAPTYLSNLISWHLLPHLN